MAQYALANFGTPRGFDYRAVGDHPLTSARVVGMFGAMGFASIEAPAGARVWGFFKSSMEAGTVVGIGLYAKVDEYGDTPSGGYMGVGLLLKDASADAVLVVASLSEYLENFRRVALDQRNSRFLAARLSYLPAVNIPQSCLDAVASIKDAPPDSLFASLAFNKIFVDAEHSGAAPILHSLLKEQQAISECRIIISDDSAVIDSFIKSGRTVIDDVQLLEMLKTAGIHVRLVDERVEEAEKPAAEKQREKDKTIEVEISPEEILGTHSFSTYEIDTSPAEHHEPIYIETANTENELEQTFQHEVKSRLAAIERRLGAVLYRGMLLSALVGLLCGGLGVSAGIWVSRASVNNDIMPSVVPAAVSAVQTSVAVTPAASAPEASAPPAPDASSSSHKDGAMYLGIYVSKNKIDYLLKDGSGHDQAQFDNTQDGFLDFKDWLDNKGYTSLAVCIHGSEGERMGLVKYLMNNKIEPLIVNSKQIEPFNTTGGGTQAVAEYCAAGLR